MVVEAESAGDHNGGCHAVYPWTISQCFGVLFGILTGDDGECDVMRVMECLGKSDIWVIMF